MTGMGGKPTNDSKEYLKTTESWMSPRGGKRGVRRKVLEVCQPHLNVALHIPCSENNLLFGGRGLRTGTRAYTHIIHQKRKWKDVLLCVLALKSVFNALLKLAIHSLTNILKLSLMHQNAVLFV